MPITQEVRMDDIQYIPIQGNTVSALTLQALILLSNM